MGRGAQVINLFHQSGLRLNRVDPEETIVTKGVLQKDAIKLFMRIWPGIVRVGVPLKEVIDRVCKENRKGN